MNLGDFLPKKPYVEEAERRVAERRKERGLYDQLDDDEIVQLMADYAAEAWQEGYNDGIGEGYDEGYAAAENDES